MAARHKLPCRQGPGPGHPVARPRSRGSGHEERFMTSTRGFIAAAATLAAFAATGSGCDPKDKDESGRGGPSGEVLGELDSVAVDSTGMLLRFAGASAPNVYFLGILPII